MPFEADALKAYAVPEAHQRLTPEACLLYAASLGCGDAPADRRFVRGGGDLVPFPTMANVLASPGFWLMDPATGIDWPRVLHGEQAVTLHRPLAVNQAFVGRTRVVGVNDRGPDRGVHVYLRREVSDAATGDPVCTVEETFICRADHGAGGSDPPPRRPHATPDRAPDHVVDLPTAANAALLYRLNGDWNPLHVDPEVARAGGFERPILHGLCTFGVAGRAVLRACPDIDPARIGAMAVRFAAPVFPGDTIRTEIWRDGEVISFRASVAERGETVLTNGRIEMVNTPSS